MDKQNGTKPIKTTRVYTAAAYHAAQAINDANPPAEGISEGPICSTTRCTDRKWGGWGWRYRAIGNRPSFYTYWTGPGAEKEARAFAEEVRAYAEGARK